MAIGMKQVLQIVLHFRGETGALGGRVSVRVFRREDAGVPGYTHDSLSTEVQDSKCGIEDTLAAVRNNKQYRKLVKGLYLVPLDYVISAPLLPSSETGRPAG
jgi:hypothetical protein